MKETVLATYERDSTLWKNANAFYKAQDWTKMECIFSDWTNERKFASENGVTIKDNNGNDVTDMYNADKYIIRLSSRRSSKDFEFTTKEEANKFFKEILHHKILTGWRKV